MNSAIDTPKNVKNVKAKPRKIDDADLLEMLSEIHLFLKERKRLGELEQRAGCTRATLLKVLTRGQFNYGIIKEAYNLRKEIEAVELEELEDLKRGMEVFAANKAKRMEYQQKLSDVETFQDHSAEYNQVNQFLKVSL